MAQARPTAPERGNRSSSVSPGAAPSRVKIHRHTAAGLAPSTRPGSVSRAPPRTRSSQHAGRRNRADDRRCRSPASRHAAASGHGSAARRDARQRPGHQAGTTPAPRAVPQPRSTTPTARRAAALGSPRHPRHLLAATRLSIGAIRDEGAWAGRQIGSERLITPNTCPDLLAAWHLAR
jgi:hypothetical protein